MYVLFSLAVVMIEITDETHFLLPIMTAGKIDICTHIYI
jgi:hypothetical protein